MTRSPAGRRAPRAGGPGPDEWLKVPGWRRPVDTLLVLAVTFATAWVGLVVIPAAANSGSPQVEDRTTHTETVAAPPTAGPSQDPSQWFAGPVYTGEPDAPPAPEAVADEPVLVAAPRAPAHKTTPRGTTTHAAPRTSAKPPAPKTTVAAAVAATVTTPPVVTSATTPTTTTPPAATTTETTPTTESTTPTTESTTPTTETTTPSTSTSEPAPASN